MKNNILSFIILLTIVSGEVLGQKKTTTSTETPKSELPKEKLLEHHKKVYDKAIKYNDMLIAREAVYNMLVIAPERIGLKDTLTYLYYNSGNHVQVILVGKEILEAKPESAEILELVAVSQQNLGLLKEALESFEKLFTLTKDTYHRYNIASLQYMLKRFGECTETLNAILASEESDAMVTISDSRGESQQVPIKAAAFNMRGVIALEINQKDVAKQNFQKALDLYPDFILAKSNMNQVDATETKPQPKK